MHRGPGERTRGLGPARRSPAWTHTLVHSPSQTPGHDSAPGQQQQQQRRAPAATHAPQPKRGGRVPAPPPPPPLHSLRLAGSFLRLRQERALLHLPPPGLTCRGCPEPVTSAVHEALTPTRAGPQEEKAEEWLVLVAGVPRPWPAVSPPPPATASGWARLPPPAPAVITCAPGSARPCPGSPTRPTAPGCARPGTWLPARQGMEGDPDLHPQGGFYHGRALIDQRRTDPPTLSPTPTPSPPHLSFLRVA